MGTEEENRAKQKEAEASGEDIDNMEGGNGNRARIEMPKLPTPLTLQEKKYLLSVERGDLQTVKKMLQKNHRHADYMNMNCLDPLGRGALHMSIDNENLEMIEMLVVMGVETRDALLYSIDKEFVEAVEVLLEHEEVVHKDGEPYSWEKIDSNIAAFTPEMTPLTLAAHRDNYEILKILLDRGATLPMPHDIRCGCPECLKSSEEDSLRHSRSRISAYRALASPSLIALSSTDPIMTAFELSDELKTLAFTENEFRADYLELRQQCRTFAQEILSFTRTSTELAVILNHDPNAEPYEDGGHMNLTRLELAIHYKQKSFVAHPNVQQLLAKLWYEGVPGFRRKTATDKVMTIVKYVALFPLYCALYMVLPNSSTGKLMRTPFMKFVIHSASYLFFLLLLILFSVRFEELVIRYAGTESMRDNLEQSLLRPRGNLPTPIECLICIYVFGFLWEECKQLYSDGFRKYLADMWNLLDVMRDSLYVMTMLLRVVAFMQQYQQISEDPQTAFIRRENWDSFDPQLISEGLFSAANILSALKLIHIFSINPYLGPLQISLGRMVIDIVKFFFIYSLVLFAFACGLTQLLWYYNDLEKQKCYSLPGGEADWVKNGDACMKWRRFHNLFEASQSLFWAGFGMVGLSDFELTGSQEYTRFWSMLMFGSYSVINIIVLLNLLIAMMSNSYSFIVDHTDTEWKFARAKLWMSYFEQGNTLPPPFNIFPTVKIFTGLFGSSNKKLMRRMSTKSEKRMRRMRDYRYLSVMRALIWRYICSLQRRNEERAVTEDDIGEVKGDISSLRFELVELFSANGMDVSHCANKSRAALGRKMRVWERRLMRDFHVSPAMGGDDDEDGPKENKKFKKLASLAMQSKFADLVIEAKDRPALSQIGFTNKHDDSRTEALKKAMERAREKMEADTPDGSPNSSRGCSPFPDLYTGPHLMDTIQNLDLSPDASPCTTPFQNGMKTLKKDQQAKDPNLLTIPGRRSQSSLKEGEKGSTIINVPTVFSNSGISKLMEIEKNEKNQMKDEKAKQSESKPAPKPTGPKPPASVTTVSESSASIKKDEAKTQKNADVKKPKEPEIKPKIATEKKPDPPKNVEKKIEPPKKDEKKIEPPKKDEKKIEPPKKDEKKIEPPKKDEKKVLVRQNSQDNILSRSSVEDKIKEAKPQAMKPSQKPQTNDKPNQKQSKENQNNQQFKVRDTITPSAVLPKIEPPQIDRGPKRRLIDSNNSEQRRQAPVKPNIPAEQEELEEMEFVRRPSKLPPPRRPSQEEIDAARKPEMPATPNICIIPSTPAPPETPESARKSSGLNITDQKPSTPPAAAFYANEKTPADEPLIKKD